jgi:serine/threonine protein kinase
VVSRAGSLPCTPKTALRTSLFDNNSSGPSGTADYIAPEAIDSTEVSFSADYWALGVIIWQLFNVSHKITPFNSSDISETFERIKAAKYEMPQGLGEETIPEVARDLISKLLVLDPAERLGAKDFDELKSHPFFEGVNFESLHAYDNEAPLLPRQKKLSMQKMTEKKFLPELPVAKKIVGGSGENQATLSTNGSLPVVSAADAKNFSISEEVKELPSTVVKQPLHCQLPGYAADDVVLRTTVRKRSRLILKLQRELVLLKDNSFAYFTCDRKNTLKKHFARSQIIKASVIKGTQLQISVQLTPSRTTSYSFYF